MPSDQTTQHDGKPIWGEVRFRRAAPRSQWTREKSIYLVVLIVCGLALVVAVAVLLERTKDANHQTRFEVVGELPSPILPTASEPVAPEFASNATVDRFRGDPCRELIDWQSGTYTNHCANTLPPKPVPVAEVLELKQKADEAMKVIEESTPEVQH